MRLTKERIHQIARNLVEHFFSEESVSTSLSKDQLASKIEQIVTDELTIEDRLNDEVRRLLAAYESQIEKGQVDYNQMFSMVKRQLAKERGIVL